MTHKFILLILFALSTSFTCASEPDSTEVDHFSEWQLLKRESWDNPALHGKAFQSDYSELALSLNYKKQSSAFVLQQGTGHTLYNINAQTFLRLSNLTSVWGQAGYETGSKRGIRFNSVADYDLLQPYILADTDGGKTRNECYTIEGGYATQKNKWLLGAEMLFRAEHEYRTFDPRIRAIVTDLTLRFGLGREFKTYNLGFGADLNIYKQTDNVKFFREVGNIPEYQLTGLGTVYSRFSGEVNNLYYKGGGFTLRLNMMPIHDNGLFGNIDASSHHYERIATSFNSLPLTKLYRETLHAQFGWKQENKLHIALFTETTFTRRLGDENIVGSSQSNNYPILTTLTMYKNNITDASVNAMVGMHKQTDWHIRLRTGYLKNKEEYVTPHRKMSYSVLHTELSGQFLKNFGQHWTVNVSVSGQYIKNLDSTMSIPVAITEPVLISMLNYNYQYLKADYTLIQSKIRILRKIKNTRYKAFAEISGGTTLCSEKGNETQTKMTLGFTF